MFAFILLLQLLVTSFALILTTISACPSTNNNNRVQSSSNNNPSIQATSTTPVASKFLNITFDPQASRDLFKAALAGDVAGIEKALNNSANVDATGNFCWEFSSTSYCTKSGTALNAIAASSTTGNSPSVIITTLINNGADLNARVENCWTPLHLAAMLMKNGADNIAALLKGGGKVIDINAATNCDENQPKWTPLHYAAWNGSPQIVQMLLERKDVNVSLLSGTNWTVLHCAVTSGNVETVKLLLKYGLDVEAVTSNGERPLMMAANNGRPQIVELLLSRGATVNSVRQDDNKTALFYAISTCSNEIVLQMLLYSRANVNLFMSGQKTPLMTAASMSNYCSVKNYLQMLVKSGADVGAKDEATGRTALWQCAMNPGLNATTFATECIQTLTDLGLSPLYDSDSLTGQSFAVHACQNGNPVIRNYIVDLIKICPSACSYCFEGRIIGTTVKPDIF